MTYTVTAKRWEKGWELHIADVGVTQARTLEAARQQAADYISTLRDVDVEPAEITLDVQLDDPELTAKARRARAELRETEKRLTKIAARQRRLARRLRQDQRLSVSDTATIMEISRGRVSQLTAENPRH